MKKFIVTTTINSPTKATRKFAGFEDWQLIVVGDLKTPHEEYEALDCIYLHPEEQESRYKALSDAIGWRCIPRRNLGFVHAYMLGADIMATVDDDNIPYDDWGQNLYVGQEVDVDLWEAKNGYFDPLSVTNRSELWHRGYPCEHIATKNQVDYLGKEKRKVMVQADLWDGDPDIDAICRLSMQPVVKFDHYSPYGSKQLSPFNSQNTFVAREAIPKYMVIPHVGRMDDIWGAYALQQHFPQSVIYNRASVYQERNEQDLVKNLEDEVIGYRNTLAFLEGRYQLPERAAEAYRIYQASFPQE